MLRITLLLCLMLCLGSLIGAAAKPKTVDVSIKGMAFSPASVNVNTGDTVNWTNDDDRDHSVSAADGSFKSGNLRSGESYSYTFTKAGKYAYGCGYHPRMKGTISVSE